MIEIQVYGRPAPQGSKRPVGRSKEGRAIMIESSKYVKPWRQDVKEAALKVMRETGAEMLKGPVEMTVVFTIKRPKSCPKTRHYPDSAPDLSKLVRSTEDALTEAGVWEDDARVVRTASRKVFPSNTGNPQFRDPFALPIPGAFIRIQEKL